MKTKFIRQLTVAIALLGLVGVPTIMANFSSVSRDPNPASGPWFADATLGSGTPNSGWTYAQYNGERKELDAYNVGKRLDTGEVEYYEHYDGTWTYMVREHTWSSGEYEWGGSFVGPKYGPETGAWGQVY